MLDPVHEKLLEGQTDAIKEMTKAVTLLCFRIESLIERAIEVPVKTTRKTKATK